ncbi:hypothetical protein ACCP96_13350 [Xanthomonas campestris pv. fici]|uniref:hypothetical protein n=1 Tax=Xanthomonas euvesicatoria TaxID=456327 RepID=UPI00355723B3
MPCEDQRYDGGWFFESIFHMGQRAALREANRILKPGALLTLTELPILPTATDDFRRFVFQRIHSSFVAKDEYPQLLDEAGFDLVEIQDITDNVMPMLALKVQEAIDDNIDSIREALNNAPQIRDTTRLIM